jgi:hypothetical protein
MDNESYKEFLRASQQDKEQWILIGEGTPPLPGTVQDIDGDKIDVKIRTRRAT